MPRSALILVAAGRGERAGGNIPKQYQSVAGQPLIRHTLKNLQKTYDFDVTCIVVAQNDTRIAPLIKDLGLKADIVTGGASRTESVRNGLLALENQAIDHVYIHDAARPFVDNALILALSEALNSHQSAVPTLPVVDALKTVDGLAFDRNKVYRAQTPQAFHYDEILKAYKALPPNQSKADDIEVGIEAGLSVSFTQGNDRNFKLTYPEDFAKADAMMTASHYTATGSGFDVHQFDKGDVLWLCGVPIECGYTLKGHSDADAGLHALTDAMLGAIAHGDIGDHFPPSDPQWKGARSDKFLLYALEQLKERGGQLQHLDVTLICEKPKIKPHRDAMRENLAKLCDLPLNRVSVKATTTEKLGFTGRGEGLAAQAIVTVVLPS